jgi:hypothetical protein
MSTASDRPGPDHDRNPPLSHAGQFVGLGTAVLGASAHRITIYNSFPGSSHAPPGFCAGEVGPPPNHFQALRRLRRLTSRLAVFADRLHAAAEALAGLPTTSEHSAAHESCACFSSTPDHDQLRRNV